MVSESEEAVNQAIDNLNRIPKEINTTISIKDLMIKEIERQIKKEARSLEFDIRRRNLI